MVLNLAGLKVKMLSEKQNDSFCLSEIHSSLRCCQSSDLTLRVFYSDHALIDTPTDFTAHNTSYHIDYHNHKSSDSFLWSMNHRRGKIEIKGRFHNHPDHAPWDLIMVPHQGHAVLRMPKSLRSFDPLTYPVNYLLIHFGGLWFTSLILHASAVDFQGRSMLFTGPSGIGKSTTASWGCQTGGMLIHDDKIRITKEADECVIYGMPSPLTFGPLRSTLKAVFILERRGQFSLETLDKSQGFEALLRNSQYFPVSQDIISQGLENISRISESMQFYSVSLPYDPESIIPLVDLLNKL